MKISDFSTSDDYEYISEASTLELNGFPSQLLVEGFHPKDPTIARVFTRERIVMDREDDAMYAIYYSEPSPMYGQGTARLTIFND